MFATILLGDVEATISNDTEFEWVSDDEELARDLNELMPPPELGGSSPQPALESAMYAISVFGGELVDYSKTPHVAGRVY